MHIYIHVPFCRSKCRYCAFFSQPVNTESNAPFADWEKAILNELRRYAALFPGQNADTLFFGGGTPSMLPANSIGRLVDCVNACFPLNPKAEISLEANPESMDPAKAKSYAALGINRISLGIQALDDDLLRVLGRAHDSRQAIAAFAGLRDAGFCNVGLDLMWGLPGQSVSGWRKQLMQAISLGPEHFSCYGLTIEQDTPFARQRLNLPDEESLAAMYMDCGEILEKHRFAQYEISNYAKSHCQCRHNMGYWLGHDYLGFGPSATSTYGNMRWTQPGDMAQWLACAANGIPFPNKETLSDQEKTEESIMLRLRMSEGLALSAPEAVQCFSSATAQDFIRQMQRRNLAKIAGGRVKLTRSGMLVSNAIIQRFFEEIHANAAKT